LGTDHALVVHPAVGKAGKITISVTNAGQDVHELVLFKTDLAPEDLPRTADGNVDEEGEGVEHIDQEIEDLQPHETRSMEVELAAGNYVAVCNEPGHYMRGMDARLQVK
jgi:uncharacterized cupredoxin-like copper-binding protein